VHVQDTRRRMIYMVHVRDHAQLLGVYELCKSTLGLLY